MANQVSFIVRLQDKYSAAAANISRATDKINRKMGSLSKKINQVQKDFQKFGKKAVKAGALIVAAFFPANLAMAKTVKQSIAMEDAMSDIGRVVTATSDQLLKFENKLESMSERLGKSKVGLAEMAFEGGKLGIALKDMEPFLDLVSKTAIAFDLQDQEAGRSIGSIRAKMGLMNDDVKILLDSINFLADNTSASGARMINIIERISGTMSILKIPPKATAALAGFADQLEVTGELAASGINMFISRMQRMPGMTTKLMADPLGTVQEMLERMAKMGPELQSRFIRKAFGDEAGRFVKKMVANVDLFGKTIDSAFSTKAVGSMQRELENQLKRSSKVFQVFEQTSTNTMDSIGDAIKPLVVSIARLVTPLINGLGEFAKANPKLVKFLAVFSAIATAVGVMTIVIGGLAIAIGLVSAPILIVMAAIAALSATIVFWEDFKSAAVSAVNAIISVLNNLLKPLNFVLETIGFDAIKIPEIKTSSSVVIDESPAAPSAPINNGGGSINGAITVSATEGAKVEKTKMQTKGAGLNFGMNMAEAL